MGFPEKGSLYNNCPMSHKIMTLLRVTVIQNVP